MLVDRTKDLGPNELVFGNDWANKDQLLRAFKNVITRSLHLDPNDGFCFHSLRHSFGTWHFASGSKPRQIMDMMGHKNIVTTLIYGKSTDEAKREAVNNLAY
jgi:integrase